ncbi:hypothetical protein V8F20_003672 [Naviculisporaceae sp. PSN 640]
MASPKRSELVPRGIHKNFTTRPDTYISHTFPVIHDNTIIVAATHPNVAKGDPTDDGWFLSNFYTFNYRLLLPPGANSCCSISPEQLRAPANTMLEALRGGATGRAANRAREAFREANNAWKNADRPGLYRYGETPAPAAAAEPAGEQPRASASDSWLSPLSSSMSCSRRSSELPRLRAQQHLASPALQSIPVSKSLNRVCGSVFVSATIAALTAASSPLIAAEGRPSRCLFGGGRASSMRSCSQLQRKATSDGKRWTRPPSEKRS